MTPPFYPVDQMLSLAIAALMGLQHALAMIGDAFPSYRCLTVYCHAICRSPSSVTMHHSSPIVYVCPRSWLSDYSSPK